VEVMGKTKKTDILIISFICVSLFFSSFGFTQTKEAWLKLERKGSGYGFDHICTQTLADGKIRYNVRQHLKTDIAGFSPQDIIQEGYYIVDGDLRPVEMDLNIKSRSKELNLKGLCENGNMCVAIKYGSGTEDIRDFPFHEVYFDVVMGKLIHINKGQKNFKLKVFNPIELRVNEYDVGVEESENGDLEATVRERITMKYSMDKNGRIKEINFVELKSRAYLTTASDAQKIDYLNTADGLTLTLKDTQVFPDIYNVVQARFKLQWKDISIDDFSFDDNRQKLMSQICDEHGSRVFLEYRRPLPPAERIELPIKDSRFAAFLNETENIKPGDPLIQKTMEDIRGDEKDAFTFVHMLLLWMYENIKTEYIAETLSGPEVLKRKSGKCTEYTTLFASLARAAGVPTRVVFGEAANGKDWTGHLWCEVWLGEWTAVDAAHGIFVTGPTHIKFIDSPTVLETHKIRWKLVDNLQIEILDFQEEKPDQKK
jgi:hypothetical protein